MVLANGATTKRAASEPSKKIATMGGSTFWLIESKRSHADAVEKCSKKGGKLASLNTQKKIDFVTSELLVNQKDTWIGAKCEDCTNVKDEKWFWPNGEQLFVSEDSEVYRNKMWKEYRGTQTPYEDSSQDSPALCIQNDSELGWMFVNWMYLHECAQILCEIEN